MFKVNVDKLLEDYHALVEKQEKGYAASEADAIVFAQAHGYNEKKTADFVAYVREIGKGGLSVVEQHKLEHLSSYIEEVADEPNEAEKELEEATENPAQPTISPNPAVNVL